MVLACDGLFDVMNHQEVADYTHKLFSEGHDASSVAKSMVLKAINDLATDDNVTVIIVKIDWENDQQVKTHEPVNDEVPPANKDHVQGVDAAVPETSPTNSTGEEQKTHTENQAPQPESNTTHSPN